MPLLCKQHMPNILSIAETLSGCEPAALVAAIRLDRFVSSLSFLGDKLVQWIWPPIDDTVDNYLAIGAPLSTAPGRPWDIRWFA